MYGIDDPSNLLQPFKNLKQFTEDLYGMFTKSADATPAPGVDEPTRAEPQPAPAPKPRSDPAGIGGVRKARLADASLARPSVSTQAKAATPDDARRTPPEGDQSPRRTAPSVSPFDLSPILATPGRKVQSTGPSRPGFTATDNVGDHSTTPRKDPAPLAAFEPAKLGPGAAFKDKPDKAATPAAQAPDQPLPGKPKAADETKTPEPYQPPLEGSQFADDARDTRPNNQPKPVLDIGDFAGFAGGGGGGTTVFMGKVDSGSGDTYQVFLYQNGPKGAADATAVEVTVPMIDPTDQIPAGTWLNGIFQFSAPPDEFGNAGVGNVYSCQPPVWMP